MAIDPIPGVSAIRRVRLFPLPETVLYPGVVQPLHIFESRYREMIEDAVDHDRLIAMATLAKGFDDQEYFGRPELERPVCIGKIMMHEKREDDTHDVLLAGITRGVILEELPVLRSFREANVAIIDDREDVPEDEATEVRDELLQQLLQRTDEVRVIGDSLQGEQIPLPRLLDALAFALPLSRETKLDLASEASVRERLKQISTALL